MKKYGVDSAGVEPAAHIFININQFSYEKNTNSEICHNRVCPFSPHPRRRGHDKKFKKAYKKAPIVPTAITLDPLSKAITMLGLSGNHEKFITLSMSIFL